MTSGDDLGSKESILIVQLDESLRPQRSIYYSVADRDAAITELDRIRQSLTMN